MLRKSMDWFLYDIGLRHERVKRSFEAIKVMDSYENSEGFKKGSRRL